MIVMSMGVSIVYSQEIENQTDKAAEYFFYRCAGCHTIGGGKLSGPDLLPATQWSAADLNPAIKKMEKNVGVMSESDISQMISFLKDMNVATRMAKQKQKIEESFRASLPPASFEIGQKLFKGQRRLANGGPSCISCHYFVHEGGSLGLDLTLIKEKASGVVLQSAIVNSSYKVMRPIYEKHVITPEEAVHLSEYLSHPEKVKVVASPTKKKVVGLAYVGVVIFFVLLWFLNRQRKGCTREKLIKKSKRGNS
ncbi:MAG: cytochrome c [Candidatus Omnitrophica bacterium]|nr:cytochrome c [Candidatus Omnitrophota bacterium]